MLRKKLRGSGLSNPCTLFCLIGAINSELKNFLIFTHLSEPALIFAGLRWPGSTPAGFQESFRAVYMCICICTCYMHICIRMYMYIHIYIYTWLPFCANTPPPDCSAWPSENSLLVRWSVEFGARWRAAPQRAWQLKKRLASMRIDVFTPTETAPAMWRDEQSRNVTLWRSIVDESSAVMAPPIPYIHTHNTHTDTHTNPHTHTHTDICMNTCKHVCIYINICTYTYIQYLNRTLPTIVE